MTQEEKRFILVGNRKPCNSNINLSEIIFDGMDCKPSRNEFQTLYENVITWGTWTYQELDRLIEICEEKKLDLYIIRNNTWEQIQEYINKSTRTIIHQNNVVPLNKVLTLLIKQSKNPKISINTGSLPATEKIICKPSELIRINNEYHNPNQKKYPCLSNEIFDCVLDLKFKNQYENERIRFFLYSLYKNEVEFDEEKYNEPKWIEATEISKMLGSNKKNIILFLLATGIIYKRKIDSSTSGYQYNIYRFVKKFFETSKIIEIQNTRLNKQIEKTENKELI